MKNKWLSAIIGLLFVLIVVSIVVFYRYGSAGYTGTILIYLLLCLTVLNFVKNKKFKYNIIAVLIILFIGESYLRISGKGNLNYTEANSNSIFEPYGSQIFGERQRIFLGYRINPPNSTFEYKTKDFDYTHYYNEMGLRERPLDSFKNSTNILILGDSFTEGVGTTYDSTLCKSIEYHLGNNLKCINAGVRGSDIVYAYQLLDTMYQLTKPKLVIFNLSYSDLADVMTRGGDERFTEKYRKQFWWEYIYAVSFIYRKIMLDVFQHNPFRITDEDMQYTMDVIMKKTIDFATYCKAKNIPFLCIITPNLNEFVYALNTFNFQDSFVELYNHTKINFINTQIGMTNYLNENKMSPDVLYHLSDLHFNTKGYWLQGAVVADFIKANYLNQNQK